MTGIEIIGNKEKGMTKSSNQAIGPAAVLQYRGMAVFVNDKMVGWLDENGTKALNYLENSIHQTIGVQNCGKGRNLSIAITDSDTRIRVHRQGDMPLIDVYVRMEADIAANECELNLSDDKVLNKLLKDGAVQLEALLDNGIKDAKRLGADIFGFGREVHRQQPSLWHKIKAWNKAFQQIQVRVHTKIYVRKIGSIDHSMTDQVKE